MKKSIIAMAVAGALAVPAIASADATLYGSFRMMLEKTDNQSASFGDNATRIGIRGTVDLGMDGTRGIYHWESGVNTNSDGNGLGNVRYASMGATGDWGTAIGGRIDHFTWNFGGGVSDLYSSGNGDILSVDYVGAGVGRIDRRVNNTLAYVSPNLSGLTLGAGVVVAGDVTLPSEPSTTNVTANDGTVVSVPTNNTVGGQKDKQVDGYNMGVNYSIAGVTVGAGYGAVKTSKNANGSYNVDQNLWSLAASYSLEGLTLAGVYEQSKDKTGPNSVKDKGYSLAARYEVDGLGGVVSYSRAKLADNDAGKRVQAEVFNRMGRGTVAAGYIDNNGNARGGVDDQFYVTYRLDF